MARKFIIQTYQKTGNISKVARIFKTTRKTVRQIIKRIRFLSYSYTKNFTNGLLFMMSVIYFVRSFGIKDHIKRYRQIMEKSFFIEG